MIKVKNFKRIKISLAILLASLSILFITYRLSTIEATQLEKIIQKFRDPTFFLFFSIVIILSFFNWSIEAVKWKKLISPRYKMTFGKSLQSIFSGISVGIFTPSRIGEFAGRIFYIPDTHKLFASLGSFVGSISQNIATIGFGLIASVVYFSIYDTKIVYEFPLAYYLIVIFTFITLLALILIYVNLAYFIDKISHWKWLQKYEDYFPHTYDWSANTLWKVLGLSVLRYMIFSAQFILLLFVFDIKLPIGEMMIKTSMIFFISTIIPSYAISDLINRGAVSIMILNMINMDIYITAAAFLLWMINLAVPALIGAVFMLIRGNQND